MPVPNLDRLKSEGDLNLSPHRDGWLKSLPAETQQVLAHDARHFLHQSLSTPCLNVLKSAQGACIEDLQGRRYLDFHA